MIPAVRWSPGSGRLVKRGSSDRATFIRKVADLAAQPAIRREISGATAPSGQQIAEQEARIDVGRDRLRPVRLAAGDGADRPAALDDDLLDRRVEDDLDALLPRRLGHRLGDRAHAADRMAPGAGHARRLAEQMVEEDVGRAGIVGAGIIADDRVEAEQGLDDVGLEIAVEDVGGGLGEEIEQVALLLGGHAAHRIAELERRQHVGEAPAGIGRRAQDPVAKDGDDRAQSGRIGVIALGVRERMAGDLAPGEAAARRRGDGRGRASEGNCRSCAAPP